MIVVGGFSLEDGKSCFSGSLYVLDPFFERFSVMKTATQDREGVSSFVPKADAPKMDT